MREPRDGERGEVEDSRSDRNLCILEVSIYPFASVEQEGVRKGRTEAIGHNLREEDLTGAQLDG